MANRLNTIRTHVKKTVAPPTVSFAIAILLVCMALPSAVKLAHAIHKHQERSCSKDSRLHFHTAEFDCEFQKFKNCTPLFITFYSYQLPTLRTGHGIVFQLYQFLSLFQNLSFSLRAPPPVS